MTEVLRYPDRVKRIEERFRNEYVSGSGDGTITRRVSEGWFIVFESNLSLGPWPERPNFIAGQSVRHTIEGV